MVPARPDGVYPLAVGCARDDSFLSFGGRPTVESRLFIVSSAVDPPAMWPDHVRGFGALSVSSSGVGTTRTPQ